MKRDSSSDSGTNQLPSWLQFFEHNTTLLAYPTNTNANNEVFVSLVCCNKLYECADNMFKINPTNQEVEQGYDTASIYYVLSWDNTRNVGETFNYGVTTGVAGSGAQYVDADQSSLSSDPDYPDEFDT